jgi:hypothetical protein
MREREIYFRTGCLPPICSSWRHSLDTQDEKFFQLNKCSHNLYVVSPLMGGWFCRLQLLMAPTSAVILRSEPHDTHDHILLSQIGDPANLEGQVPVFTSPRNRVAQLYPQVPGSLSSPPTTHRAPVVVLEPTSTRSSNVTNYLKKYIIVCVRNREICFLNVCKYFYLKLSEWWHFSTHMGYDIIYI